MTARRWMAAMLLLAACGGDGESTSPPATTTATTSTTSTPATTSTTEPSESTGTPVTEAAGGCTTPVFDPSGEPRDQFVGYLVACGFTEQESDCIYEGLDFSDPAVIAGDIEAILAAIESCGITPERMEEIVTW